MLDTPDDERVEISYQEYVVDMVAAFQQHCADEAEGFAAFSQYILGSLAKIRKRLGGIRYQSALAMMQNALNIQEKTGDTSAHLDWVRFILLDYYDPMYDYQISKKQARLKFRGDIASVREYLLERRIV